MIPRHQLLSGEFQSLGTHFHPWDCECGSEMIFESRNISMYFQHHYFSKLIYNDFVLARFLFPLITSTIRNHISEIIFHLKKHWIWSCLMRKSTLSSPSRQKKIQMARNNFSKTFYLSWTSSICLSLHTPGDSSLIMANGNDIQERSRLAHLPKEVAFAIVVIQLGIISGFEVVLA